MHDETQRVLSKIPTTALLCDVDGTIMDTFAAMHASFNHALKPHGKSAEAKATMEVVRKALKLETCFEHLLKTTDKEVCKAAAATYRAHFGSILATATRAFPGVIDGLRKLREHPMPICVGIVSNRVAHMEASLKNCGMLDLIDQRAIITGGMMEETKHKPDPFGVHMALEKLGMPPEQAAFAGDTFADMQAAKAAGIPLRFYLTWGYGAAETCNEATHVVKTFDDIVTHLLKT